MRRHEHMAIARIIRDLPCDRLLVAERFAAMLAERNPAFDRNRFLAAALWGIERRRDGGGRSATSPKSSATSADGSDRSPNRARTLTVRPFVNRGVTADLIRTVPATLIHRRAEQGDRRSVPVSPTCIGADGDDV